MKFIVKQPEPSEFTAWKLLANEEWQPSYSALSGHVKASVKSALMAEQSFLCCYCERRLVTNDAHIEHFKPQSDPSVDPLDFSNLLCSCQNQIKSGDPRHCGNLKADWFDDELLVSPLDEGCAKRFVFMGNGHIRASEKNDVAALETITHLGLDIPKLNALRSKAIEPFLDANLSDDDLRAFIAGYLKKDAQHKLGEFWTTIDHLFGAMAA